MLIPETDGVMLKVFVPVPPIYEKAVDESAREYVVVMLDPPPTASGPFTLMVMRAIAVDPTASVTVIVSM